MYHCGSCIGTPLLSAPAGKIPLSGRESFHFVTKDASESTFAKGPMQAARIGMAVEANHHDLTNILALCS